MLTGCDTPSPEAGLRWQGLTFTDRKPGSGGGRAGASDEAGFSLIELVVVTSIIATLSLSAVLGLRWAGQGSPAARIDDFARAVRYLQAEALFADRSFALGFAQEGWQVMVLDEAGQTWVRRDPEALHGAGGWGTGNRMDLRIEDLAVALRPAFPEAPTPDVFVLPSGETTPFRVTLSDTRDRRADCAMQSHGELQCQRGG